MFLHFVQPDNSTGLDRHPDAAPPRQAFKAGEEAERVCVCAG